MSAEMNLLKAYLPDINVLLFQILVCLSVSHIYVWESGGGKEVRDGLWLDDDHNVVDRLQLGSHKQHVVFMLWHSCLTTTWWHSDLADDVSLFSLYFSFLHLHTSYSPQAHLQSSHCIVTVYILAHNVLPASQGCAQKKKSKQSTTTSIHAHCTTSQSRLHFLTHTFSQLNTHSRKVSS